MKKEILIIIAIITLFIGILHGYYTNKPEPVYIYETNYTETITQIDDMIITQEKVLQIIKTPIRGNKSLNKNQTINNYK